MTLYGLVIKTELSQCRTKLRSKLFFQFCKRQNLKLFSARAVKKEFSDLDGTKGFRRVSLLLTD